VVIVVPPTMTVAAIVASMRYHTLSQVRHVMAEAVGATLAEAETIVHLLDTYDPEREAVVTIWLDEHAPLIVTLPFKPAGVRASWEGRSLIRIIRHALRIAHRLVNRT
jgi:hypothetical protein